MKARLIIDSEGPNPEFNPPRREQFAEGTEGDEAFHDAKALYDVPPVIIVPAGTILPSSEHLAIHCFPDSSNIRIDGKGNPCLRGLPVVRAVPVDDGCQAALDKIIAHYAAARKKSIADIEKLVADGVARSLAAQAECDRSKAPGPTAA
jgi:hypothetical protein